MGNVIIMLSMVVIMVIGLIMYCVPGKCVKKEDATNIEKVKKAKRNGIILFLISVIALFAINTLL